MRLTGYATIGGLTAVLVAAIFEARGVSELTYLLLLWVAVVAVLVGQLRSYVKLGEWRLTVQNPLRRYEIALLEIEEVGGKLAGVTALWRPDPALPERFVVESGSIIEPGFELPYRLHVHCGIEWLGQLNDLYWRTEVPNRQPRLHPAGMERRRRQ